MSATIEALRTALARVEDPDLKRDLVSLNMVRELRVEGDLAAFDLVLTTGACPVKQQLEDACRAAALSVPGIARADIRVSAEVPKGFGAEALPGVAHVIGVGSGKGGVGKSTVAVNLACALAAAGARVGLLDADIQGPSLPTMLGDSREPYVANKKLVPLEAHGLRFLSMGLIIDRDEAVILRGPMVGRAVQQLVVDADWGRLDYLLVDLPPGTGDVQLSLTQTVPLAGAVVVTTPQAVALADVRRAVAMFGKVNVPIFGVVENMSGYTCGHCGHHEPIFDVGGGERYAAELGVPFLGAVPIDPAVRICGDIGAPAVISRPASPAAQAFTRIAQRVAQACSVAALQGDARPATPAGDGSR